MSRRGSPGGAPTEKHGWATLERRGNMQQTIGTRSSAVKQCLPASDAEGNQVLGHNAERLFFVRIPSHQWGGFGELAV